MNAPECGSGLLTAKEREVLSLLSEQHGTTTGDLAREMPSMKMWGYSRGTQSNLTLHVLQGLEACGLVKRMDAERPIAWLLVAAGGQK